MWLDVYNCGWNYSRCCDIVLPVKKDIIILVICCIIYTINRLWNKGIDVYFLHCYLNDLIVGIAFPAYVNILLHFRNQRMEKLFIILGLMFIVGCFWEFVAPCFVPYAVTDYWDLAAYCFGALMYWAIDRRFWAPK